MDNINSLYRNHYPADQISSINPKHNYTGEVIAESSDANRAVKVVDEAIRVQTVTDEIRQNATQEWSKQAKRADIGVGISAFVVTVSVITAIVGAFILGTAASMPFLIAGAAVIGTAALVCAVGLVALAVAKGFKNRAQKNLKSWQDPVAEIAAHRRQASEKGFQYIVGGDDLRKQAFHEAERKSIELKSMTREMNKFDYNYANQVKQAEDLTEFFETNPLASWPAEQDHHLDPQLQSAIHSYRLREGQYRAFVEQVRRQKQMVEEQSAALIGAVNVQKDEVLRRLLDCKAKPKNQRTYTNKQVDQAIKSVKQQADQYRQAVEQDAKATIDEISEWEIDGKAQFALKIAQILHALVENSPLQNTRVAYKSTPTVCLDRQFGGFDLHGIQLES